MKNNLAAWMDRAGFSSSSSLAREVGVSRQRVSRVVRCEAQFSVATVASVAKVIADRVDGASVGDVLTGLVCPEADDWCPPLGGEE